MLNIIKSSFCAPGHERIKKEILERVLSGQRVLLIVPEQQTVIAEGEMADLLPTSAPLNFEVTNFTRLANSTARALGGLSGEYCDKTKKSLIMWRALTELSPHLSSANTRQVNEGLVSRYLAAANQLSAASISADDLTHAASREELTDGRLKAKLGDLGAVYSLYKRLLSEKYADGGDDCQVMLEKLRINPDYLRGAFVYLEGFTSFTEPQYSILGELSARLNLTVLFGISKVNEDSFEFTEVREAIERLKRAARLAGSDIRLSYESTPQNPESPIARSSELLWRTSYNCDNISLQNPEQIRIFEAETPYDECEFIASDIKRRVTEGAFYSDFAIVARSLDKYSGILDAALFSREIPAFMSRRKDSSSFEAIKLIYTAYAAIRSGFSREAVISYAKCSLCGISRDECDELEYYVEKWQINGSRFTDGELWNMNPGGYTTIWREGSAERLIRINEIKTRLVSPLLTLAKEASGAKTVADQARVLVSFLTSIELPARLADRANALRSMGEHSFAEETARLWRVICDSLDILAEVSGDLVADTEAFVGQLKVCFGNIDMAKIPSYAHEVTVGNADMIRLYGKKHIYLLGVNAGEFPGNVSDNAYFTERDKQTLSSLGLSISPELEVKGARELYIFTRAYTYATESLTLSYSARDTKYKARERGGVTSKLISLFGSSLKVRKISELDLSERIWSTEDALKQLSVADSAEAQALESALYRAGFSEILDKCKENITNDSLSLTPTEVSADRSMALTQSRIDTFRSCPLSHFCRYTLSLSPEEVAEFDARNIGTFVHAILENAFSEVAKNDIDTGSLSKQERAELTKRAAEKYLKELGEGEITSAMTKIKLSRLLRATEPIVDELCDEFAESGFKPKFFELSIGSGKEDSPEAISLTSPEGRRVSIYGFIDRVDTYKQGGDVFVRVVDYKTGTKKFSPEDIAEGKNLQMFLYLKSIIDSKNPKFLSRLDAEGRVIPAGVIYQKTALSDVKIDAPDDALAVDTIKANQGREGMVLDNYEVLSAMGLKYTPVFDKKNPEVPSPAKKDYTFSEEGFDKIMDDALLAVGKVADGISGGNIKAEPMVEKGGATRCEYCEFKPLCRAAVIK